jgi:hypothetical protein
MQNGIFAQRQSLIENSVRADFYFMFKFRFAARNGAFSSARTIFIPPKKTGENVRTRRANFPLKSIRRNFKKIQSAWLLDGYGQNPSKFFCCFLENGPRFAFYQGWRLCMRAEL